MVGLPIRSELASHTSLLQDQVSVWEFNRVGFLSYFIRLNSQDEAIVVEFLCTFSNGIAYVKGLWIEALEAQIAEVSWLPATGEPFSHGHDAHTARAKLSLPTDTTL